MLYYVQCSEFRNSSLPAGRFRILSFSCFVFVIWILAFHFCGAVAQLAYGSLSQRLREESVLSNYFVYFLRSKKDESLYIGQTNNIEQRLQRHNKGQVTSTKGRIPFDLIHFETYSSRQEAMLREKELKSSRGIKEKK